MDLATTNNQTFIWTVSLAPWAAIVNLVSARFYMEVRAAAGDPNVELSFDSIQSSTAFGSARYSPLTNYLTLRAPLSAVRRLPVGTHSYGLLMSLPLPSSADPWVKLLAAGALLINDAEPKL